MNMLVVEGFSFSPEIDNKISKNYKKTKLATQEDIIAQLEGTMREHNVAIQMFINCWRILTT